MPTDQVLVSLMSLLAEPNLGDVLNDDAARLYEEDREAYATKVREAVRRGLIRPASPVLCGRRGPSCSRGRPAPLPMSIEVVHAGHLSCSVTVAAWLREKARFAQLERHPLALLGSDF